MNGHDEIRTYLWPAPDDPGIAGVDRARFNRQRDEAFCLTLRAAIFAGREQAASAAAAVRLRQRPA